MLSDDYPNSLIFDRPMINKRAAPSIEGAALLCSGGKGLLPLARKLEVEFHIRQDAALAEAGVGGI